MSKHTPGPWTVKGVTYGVPGAMADVVYVEVKGDPGHVIAHVYGQDLDNARLIAAAPELLQALRAMDPDNPSRSDCNGRKCGECSTCRARAAIAKAGGEA